MRRATTLARRVRTPGCFGGLAPSGIRNAMQLDHLRGQRAAAYARYSSDQQDAMSIDSQLAAIGVFAERHGIILPDDLVFRDDAVSGQRRSRPGLDRLLAAAQATPRRFDLVLLYNWSRLARGRDGSFEIKRQIRSQLGLGLVSVSEPTDPDSTAGFINEAMHEVVDELYVRKLSADTRRGLRQAAEEGYWTGGPAPFGYRLVRVDDERGRTTKGGRTKERSRLEIVPAHAEVVRQIYDLKRQGLGIKRIARQLNADPLVPRPRSGEWGPSTIRHIVRNPIYAGRPEHGRLTFAKGPDGKRKKRQNPDEEVIQMDRPELRIVTDAMWDDVQQQTAANTRGTRARGQGRRAIAHLFSSMIRCDVCGGTFVARTSPRKNGPRYVKYVCHRRANLGTCTNMTVVDEEKLARRILDMLEKDLYSEANIRRLVQMTSEIISSQLGYTDDLRQEIEAELAQLDREIANFNQAIAQGGQIPELVGELRQRSERRAQLRGQLDDIRRLSEQEQQLDDLEAEVRARVKDTLALIRDTDSAPAFQTELRHHIDSMTALPTGLLTLTGRLVGALPMRMVAGAGFEPVSAARPDRVANGPERDRTGHSPPRVANVASGGDDPDGVPPDDAGPPPATTGHLPCGTCVARLPPELRELIRRWPQLDANARTAIAAITRLADGPDAQPQG